VLKVAIISTSFTFLAGNGVRPLTTSLGAGLISSPEGQRRWRTCSHCGYSPLVANFLSCFGSSSEFNASETEPVHFLQIWIGPDREGLTPGYEQRAFPEQERRSRLRLITSGDGSDESLTIHQDVNVYDALLASGEEILYRIVENRYAWIQVIKGTVNLNGVSLRMGGGAAISEEASLTIEASEDAEIMLFDLA